MCRKKNIISIHLYKNARENRQNKEVKPCRYRLIPFVLLSSNSLPPFLKAPSVLNLFHCILLHYIFSFPKPIYTTGLSFVHK